MGLLGSAAVAGGAPDSAALDAAECSRDHRLGGWVAGAASTLQPRPLVIQPRRRSRASMRQTAGVETRNVSQLEQLSAHRFPHTHRKSPLFYQAKFIGEFD